MSQKETDALRRAGRDTGHSEFAERLVRALGEGMLALEALPRDDEFWRGWANDRATPLKLDAFATERLALDPTDRTARWALVALALARGANDGGMALLGPEIATDPAVVADALAIADWVGQEIGLDLVPDLRAACARADPDALKALARTEQGAAARTALRILRTPAPLPGGPC
ncbi:hypothetical protein [Streptomyces yangpuensis]|uniref:hypothetical protein n=1 Tax=Streptomyces yangpuensis TaxID=1648182 RepID=UPI003820F879